MIDDTAGDEMRLLGRTTLRLEPWEPGFAVGRDWSVGGAHEFIGFRLTEAKAGWSAVANRNYWRRGPVRPLHSVVVISAGDFELHPDHRDCKSPNCPAAPHCGASSP